MVEGSTLKLTIDKGPKAGETLTYSPRSSIKIGRLVKGNTITIKDAGISSNHIHIQFDNKLNIWTIHDLDSSNGTLLNSQTLKPYVPVGLNNGDCIKIGELTSIVVNIGADSAIPLTQNPRRKGKLGSESVPGSGSVAGVEKGVAELGLGFEGDVGENEMKEPVERRNLRGRGKKGVELKDEVDVLSNGRVLRSAKKKDVKVVEAEAEPDASVSIEPRMTRGRRRMLVQPVLDEKKPVDSVVLGDGKRTRGRRKGVRVEPLDGNEAVFNNVLKDQLEIITLGEDSETNNEADQEHVVEKLVSSQKDCEGKEASEELEYKNDGCEGIVKDTGSDDGRWKDLEKMTLLDFFCYLEVQLPKEIYDKSEKIISELEEKANKYHEFMLQRNESGKGNPVAD